MSHSHQKSEEDLTVHELREELDTEASKKQYRYLRFMCQETLDHVSFVNSRVKEIEGFWLSTLLKQSELHNIITSKSDKEALKSLTQIELVQDPKDPRPFSLKFHFKENSFFSDSVLEKKYSLPEGVEAAPADGSITQNMREFDADAERSLTSDAVKINWKSEDKNLCARHPRSNFTEESGEYDGDIGSFFHYFTEAEDILGVGAILQGEVLPDAVDYFAGRGENAESDGEDFDEDEDELDEDDDDEGSIDLGDDEDEGPSKKKSKTG